MKKKVTLIWRDNADETYNPLITNLNGSHPLTIEQIVNSDIRDRYKIQNIDTLIIAYKTLITAGCEVIIQCRTRDGDIEYNSLMPLPPPIEKVAQKIRGFLQ